MYGHCRLVFPYSCTHSPRVWWSCEGRGSARRRRNRAWWDVRVWTVCQNKMSKQKFPEISKSVSNANIFQVNLVESSGSLTPEELGQMQSMSVVLARFAILSFSTFFSMSTHFWFLKREVSERWNRGSSLQGRQCRGTQVILVMTSLHLCIIE